MWPLSGGSCNPTAYSVTLMPTLGTILSTIRVILCHAVLLVASQRGIRVGGTPAWACQNLENFLNLQAGPCSELTSTELAHILKSTPLQESASSLQCRLHGAGGKATENSLRKMRPWSEITK